MAHRERFDNWITERRAAEAAGTGDPMSQDELILELIGAVYTLADEVRRVEHTLGPLPRPRSAAGSAQ